jgi:hypothetical protein
MELAQMSAIMVAASSKMLLDASLLKNFWKNE